MGVRRCCQTNANQSMQGQWSYPLCHAQVTPLSESGNAVKLEVFSAVEVAFLVEMIVDRRVDGDGFLQCSRSSEAQHRPLSSSKRLM